MPDWEYKQWNENNFDVNQVPYTKEAYEARKYAFVSDYVRLWALCNEGGLYLDTDVEVFKPFDDLMGYTAFGGFEGSKYIPMGTCVLASEANGIWVKEQLGYYSDRFFVLPDGSYDLTTNVQFISSKMREQGFVQNGEEQDFKDLHIFPVEFFCPRQTTGEYLKTTSTYCDHLGMASWNVQSKGWKTILSKIAGPKMLPYLIKTKRKLFG